MNGNTILALATIGVLASGAVCAQTNPPGKTAQPAAAAKPATPANAAKPAAPPAKAAFDEASPAANDFGALDADKDGQVSIAEASRNPALREAFENCDKNHDGLLTRAEFAKWGAKGTDSAAAVDPATAPSGSAGAQHMTR